MREGFKEISSGWTLISGMDDITDRIERLAAWTKANGPLEADEQSTIELMIKSQIARGMYSSDEPDYGPEECPCCGGEGADANGFTCENCDGYGHLEV